VHAKKWQETSSTPSTILFAFMQLFQSSIALPDVHRVCIAVCGIMSLLWLKEVCE